MGVTRRIRLFLSSVLFLFSCTGGISFREFMAKRQEGNPSIYYIEGVPFFKQSKYHCGPSALASVLNYYEQKVSINEIIDALESETVRGSLNIEMLLFPRRFGLITEMINGDIESVKNNIRKRRPAILLIDNGFSIYRIPHYIVVTGYDYEENVFLAHWGDEENRVISGEDLERRWMRMGGWGFVTVKIPWNEMSAEEHNDIGVAYENAERYEDAEREYKEALRIKPGLCEPNFNLGNLYFKKNNYAESEKSFLKALEVCKNKGDIYNNLAYLYLKLNRRKEAAHFIERALELFPNNPEYLDTKKMIEEGN